MSQQRPFITFFPPSCLKRISLQLYLDYNFYNGNVKAYLSIIASDQHMETSSSHWTDRMPAHKTCFSQPGRCGCLCDSVSGSQEMGQEHRNWEIWPKGGRMNGKTQRPLISTSRWDFPTAHMVVLYQGTGAWGTRGKRVGGSWNAGQSKAFNTRLQRLTWCNLGSKGCKEDCGLDTISVWAEVYARAIVRAQKVALGGYILCKKTGSSIWTQVYSTCE